LGVVFCWGKKNLKGLLTAFLAEGIGVMGGLRPLITPQREKPKPFRIFGKGNFEFGAFGWGAFWDRKLDLTG